MFSDSLYTVSDEYVKSPGFIANISQNDLAVSPEGLLDVLIVQLSGQKATHFNRDNGGGKFQSRD